MQAQQNRSWEFDLEEGTLDAGRLARVVANPTTPLSFKIEKDTEFGKDCIFLDRQTVPGKAVCGIYELRPMQCKTWPFWPHVVSTEHAWRKAAVGGPGIDRGQQVIKPEEIRIQRARTPM